MPEPINTYLALPTAQWRTAANFNEWLTANLQLFQDVNACASLLPSAFDISIAFGVQLDVLGVILGQSRQVAFQPTGGANPILDDDTYRLLLQARIQQNHWNGQIDSLIAIWQSLFSGGTLIVNDGQDMTVTISLAGAFSSMIEDLLLQGYILPRPQGVRYIYNLATLPVFGLDRSDAYVAGLDLGYLT
jgi:hypothetical protein